ncbi:MAG: DinB family protein [Chitinophagaceae bacterium]
MEHGFNIIDLAQNNIIRLHEGLSIQQLNKVPTGFNNNLVWNFAHVVASLQNICYVRAGLTPRLKESFIINYKVGTKPEAFVTAEQYDSFKELAIEGLSKLKEDYNNNHFKDFKPFTTVTGVAMNDIDFAIRYVGMHHGIHQGVSTALIKVVA